MVLPLLLQSDFDAADRFAEIAGAVVNGTIVGGAHGGNDKSKLASGELKLSIAGLARAINLLRAPPSRFGNKNQLTWAELRAR